MTSLQVILENWVPIVIAALCIGLDKGGMKPLSIIATFLLTTTFGPRTALAVSAPILLAGDLLPIFHYRDSINFKLIKNFFPWVALGLALGAVIGSSIDDSSFRSIIGVIILFMSLIIIAQELKLIHYSKMRNPLVTTGLGISSGFASIIGNASGAVTSIYFIGLGLPKRAFIGTNATLYSMINTTKLLIFILYWSVITPSTLLISVVMVPIILLGTFISCIFIRFLPERLYRTIIIASIVYSGMMLLLS